MLDPPGLRLAISKYVRTVYMRLLLANDRPYIFFVYMQEGDVRRQPMDKKVPTICYTRLQLNVF
jgi:hypothetical protein